MRPAFLLIEDEACVMDLLAAILAPYDCELMCATSLGAARTQWMEAPERFKLAVVDQSLPDGIGSEFAIELANGPHPIPVLMLSGHDQRDLDLPPDTDKIAFLQKPFELQSLLAWVDDVLNRQGGNRPQRRELALE